jgi:transposase
MSRPYSEDLRERILKVVDEKKMTMEEISKMFKIDRKPYIGGGKGEKKQGA